MIRAFLTASSCCCSPVLGKIYPKFLESSRTAHLKIRVEQMQRQWVVPSEDLMYYRGPVFLAVEWFGSSPTTFSILSLSQSSCASTVEGGERGGGRSQKLWRPESLVLYIVHKIPSSSTAVPIPWETVRTKSVTGVIARNVWTGKNITVNTLNTFCSSLLKRPWVIMSKISKENSVMAVIKLLR